MDESEVTFLDTIVYKGDSNESILDMQVHYNSDFLINEIISLLTLPPDKKKVH